VILRIQIYTSIFLIFSVSRYSASSKKHILLTSRKNRQIKINVATFKQKSKENRIFKIENVTFFKEDLTNQTKRLS